MSKAVYIGAGTDFVTLNNFKEIKVWILVDSLPLSEFGIKRDKYRKNKSFLPELFDKAEEFDFFYLGNKDNNEEILSFFNPITKQELTYIFNCAIPEEYSKIIKYIKNWDVLVDIGFHPNNVILQEANPIKKLKFIGSQTTSYSYDIENKNVLINDIYKDKAKFSNYSLITKKNKILTFKTLLELDENKNSFCSSLDSDFIYSPLNQI